MEKMTFLSAMVKGTDNSRMMRQNNFQKNKMGQSPMGMGGNDLFSMGGIKRPFNEQA